MSTSEEQSSTTSEEEEQPEDLATPSEPESSDEESSSQTAGSEEDKYPSSSPSAGETEQRDSAGGSSSAAPADSAGSSSSTAPADSGGGSSPVAPAETVQDIVKADGVKPSYYTLERVVPLVLSVQEIEELLGEKKLSDLKAIPLKERATLEASLRERLRATLTTRQSKLQSKIEEAITTYTNSDELGERSNCRKYLQLRQLLTSSLPPLPELSLVDPALAQKQIAHQATAIINEAQRRARLTTQEREQYSDLCAAYKEWYSMLYAIGALGGVDFDAKVARSNRQEAIAKLRTQGEIAAIIKEHGTVDDKFKKRLYKTNIELFRNDKDWLKKLGKEIAANTYLKFDQQGNPFISFTDVTPDGIRATLDEFKLKSHIVWHNLTKAEQKEAANACLREWKRVSFTHEVVKFSISKSKNKREAFLSKCMPKTRGDWQSWLDNIVKNTTKVFKKSAIKRSWQRLVQDIIAYDRTQLLEFCNSVSSEQLKEVSATGCFTKKQLTMVGKYYREQLASLNSIPQPTPQQQAERKIKLDEYVRFLSGVYSSAELAKMQLQELGLTQEELQTTQLMAAHLRKEPPLLAGLDTTKLDTLITESARLELAEKEEQQRKRQEKVIEGKKEEEIEQEMLATETILEQQRSQAEKEAKIGVVAFLVAKATQEELKIITPYIANPATAAMVLGATSSSESDPKLHSMFIDRLKSTLERGGEWEKLDEDKRRLLLPYRGAPQELVEHPEAIPILKPDE